MKVFTPLVIILIIYSILFGFIKKNTLYDDEHGHYEQIRLFLNNKPVIYKHLSLIPGYHFTIAAVATLLGTRQIPQLRTISFTINLLTIVSFYLISRKLDKSGSLTKVLQFSFFPILFPFQFLLYAEGLMLLLTLLSFYFAHTKKYTLSAFFGLLSVLVRQQNIVWLLFINLICLTDDLKLRINPANMLRKFWLFIVSYILFIAYVFLNGGIAYGTSDIHPNFSIYSGNFPKFS